MQWKTSQNGAVHRPQGESPIIWPNDKHESLGADPSCFIWTFAECVQGGGRKVQHLASVAESGEHVRQPHP